MGDPGDEVDRLVGQLAALAVAATDNRPPKKYRCGVCKEIGMHFINDCPKAKRTGKRTPYQGDRRAFGQYQCKRCLRLWLSSRSWANTTQQCEACRINIYPHRQTPLQKPGGLDNCDMDKEHPSELCGMCIKLGHACISKSGYYPRRKKK